MAYEADVEAHMYGLDDVEMDFTIMRGGKVWY